MDNKYISPAYVVSQKVCPYTKTEKCVYDTQGKVTCNGPVTEGAKESKSTLQTTTAANEQLYQRFVNEKFTWK